MQTSSKDTAVSIKLINSSVEDNKNKAKQKSEKSGKCHECGTKNIKNNYIDCSNSSCNMSFCIKCIRRYNVSFKYF